MYLLAAQTWSSLTTSRSCSISLSWWAPRPWLPLEGIFPHTTGVFCQSLCSSVRFVFSLNSQKHLFVIPPLCSFLKKNPNSVLGKPGPLQGLNTGRFLFVKIIMEEFSGVVLFNLERMRRSSLLSQYLQPHRCNSFPKYPINRTGQGWRADGQVWLPYDARRPGLVHQPTVWTTDAGPPFALQIQCAGLTG